MTKLTYVQRLRRAFRFQRPTRAALSRPRSQKRGLQKATACRACAVAVPVSDQSVCLHLSYLAEKRLRQQISLMCVVRKVEFEEGEEGQTGR